MSYPYEDALAYSYAASAAYCSAEELRSWSCAPCRASKLSLTGVQVFENASTDARAFVGKDGDGRLVLAFRGSHTLSNFIDDLKFLKADYALGCDGCKVHSGFFSTYNSIRASVLKAIGALHTPGARLVVAGHSLGAAVATLAVYDVTQTMRELEVEALHTYGSPRLGNAAFAKHVWATRLAVLAGGAWRHTHWRDPVPHLPLAAMDFAHVPTEVWFNEASSSYTVCDGSGEDTKCANSLDLFVSVEDHLHYFGHAMATDACTG
uniref:Fungal lipase-type domain-containing protein n=1 Tax=Calcidiscus leptoporus TaxID=127549 RepID=A0A7S0P3T4_9EUKA